MGPRRSGAQHLLAGRHPSCLQSRPCGLRRQAREPLQRPPGSGSRRRRIRGLLGEWNTACVIGVESIIDIYNPANQTARNTIARAFEELINDYVKAFPDTPVVMLGIGSENNELTGVMAHAAAQGAGWRVDCWGDWDMGGTRWSHQTTIYPDMEKYVTAAYPGFADVWKHAPVQLEICYTMEAWAGSAHRYSIDAPDGKAYKSFQWAKDKHASVLNFKRGKIPSQYVSAMNDLLRVNGYRFAIDSFENDSAVAPGHTLHFTSHWSNLGVAPMYVRRPLTYRLRSASNTVAFESTADVRTWLPGSWTVKDEFTLPRDTSPETYAVEVAILDRAGTNPTWTPLPPIRLGIAGRRDDGWYPVSQIRVR